MVRDEHAVALRPNSGRALWALAGLTICEALGDRYLHIALAIAAIMATLTLSVSQVAIFAHERVLIDGALTTLTLTPLLLTMAAALVLMERDVGQRSASALLAHPISLNVWLMGRFLGLWALMVTEVAAMAAVFAAVLLASGLTVTGTLALAVLLIPVECTLALGITMMVRCMSQRAVAAVTAVIIVGAGYFTLDAAELSRHKPSFAWLVVKAAQTVLPQMQRVNLRGEAAWGIDVPGSMVGYAVTYGVGYSGCALLVGMLALKLKRRP